MSDTMTLAGECLNNFEVGDAVFFGPMRRPGASRKTLLHRVEYGGRKGRSAARRLRRYPCFGSYTITQITHDVVTFA